MNATEKIVFSNIVKNLKESIEISWEKSGDINEWATYATKMYTATKNSINIIEGLLEAPTEMNKK